MNEKEEIDEEKEKGKKDERCSEKTRCVEQDDAKFEECGEDKRCVCELYNRFLTPLQSSQCISWCGSH
jgi:hypothetical protein